MNEDLEDIRVKDPHEAFRSVRNKIIKYKLEIILTECIKYMNNSTIDDITMLKFYPPWRLLLLAKWVIMYGDFNPWKPKEFLPKDFISLVNKMYDFEGAVSYTLDYSNPYLLIRMIAFQQFWLQNRQPTWSFPRQMKLFGHLDHKHPFNVNFYQVTGIYIDEFIQLSVCLLTKFGEGDEVYVTDSCFDAVKDHYVEGTIPKYLSILSRDLASLHEWLLSLPKTNYITEYHEENPLSLYPLIRHNNGYLRISPVILNDRLQYYIYDMLRETSKDVFMNKFGHIFSDYIKEAITKLGLPYLTEEEARDKYQVSGKIVDFVIQDSDSLILVEAKGVELPQKGKFSTNKDIIADRIETSVLKGIEQGIATASAIIKAINNPSVNLQIYLIIVTYGDTYVGNGGNLGECIEEEQLKKLFIGDNVLQMNKIYPVSINEFDEFIQLVRQTHKRPCEI